jgi:hypothetical protein
MAITLNKETPKKYRVYYELAGQISFWHLDIRQENQRVWTPHISTEGKILAVLMFSGIILNKDEIYEDDVVYISGEGFTLVKFPFFDLYERIYTGDQSDIQKKVGNIYESPELIKLVNQ